MRISSILFVIIILISTAQAGELKRIDNLTPAEPLLESKSKGKAFLFSLLLPGAGEYYLGKKKISRTFFITELVLWAGYFSFQTYSQWRRDDMYVFASTHAGVDISGKPAQYFVDIGNYDDIFQYNDAKQRQGRFYDVYAEADYYWSWDSSVNRQKFEGMRISSDRARNRAVFVIGGIIANHLVSAIDAVWQNYRLNKKRKKTASIHIFFTGNGYDKLAVTIQRQFSFQK